MIFSFLNSLKRSISGNLFLLLFLIILAQIIFEKEGILSVTVAAMGRNLPKEQC